MELLTEGESKKVGLWTRWAQAGGEIWKRITENYLWTVLFFLLSPFLFLARSAVKGLLLIQVFRRTRQKRTDPKMMCPGCGWRTGHEFKYDAYLKAIVHECPRCKANWCSPTFKVAEEWDVSTRRPTPRKVQAVAEETEEQ